MSRVITDVEQQVLARLEELRPLVEEYRQLEEVAAAFERARRDPGEMRASRSGSARPRAEQALALVRERPGITVAELADELGIGPTYLYRIMPALEREGAVTKSGRGYEPVDE